jgi:hypothetical protein
MDIYINKVSILEVDALCTLFTYAYNENCVLHTIKHKYIVRKLTDQHDYNTWQRSELQSKFCRTDIFKKSVNNMWILVIRYFSDKYDESYEQLSIERLQKPDLYKFCQDG